MNPVPKRIVELRLIVITAVNVNDPEFVERLRQNRPKTVAEVVASEVVANLESVSYVEFALATQL